MNPMFRMWRCYFSGLLDAGRWRMFLHSRMWLGLPVAAVAAFVVIFLLRRFGEGLPTAEAFWKGAVYALVIAFCWALGVWAAVGPEPSDDDGRQDGEAVGNVGSIVEGAVSMVHMALDRLGNEHIVELDEERKAAMVSNLLVVLCADEAAQPVVNAGTLHH